MTLYDGKCVLRPIRFAMWGIGKRGEWLIELLKGKIVLIVDENFEYHNTYYQKIRIVSPKTYMERYKHIPIIITPRGAEYVIKEKLLNKGIFNTFCFSDNIFLLEGFLMQASKCQLIKEYSKEEKIAVYGLNILGILIYEFLRSEGFQCKLLLQESATEQLKHYVVDTLQMENSEWKEVLEGGDRLLLALKSEDSDKSRINEFSGILENYFDLGKRKSLYYYKELEYFKNIYKGRRCFIVATGPSLRIEDLDKLYEYKETCISVNGIFKAFDRTLWRPDYYMVSDANFLLENKETIRTIEVKEKFIADGAWFFEKEEVTSNMHKWHFQKEWNDGIQPEFSDDFARVSYCGRTVVYEGALQLAVYMGFSEIYLLGVDCCRYATSEKQHFISEYEKKKRAVDLDVEYNILAYKSAREYADLNGIRIFNATRGGKLEVFDRVNFDELFNFNQNEGRMQSERK